MSQRMSSLAVLAALGLAACAEAPSSPTTQPVVPTLSRAAIAAGSGRHLVSFSGSVPADFAGRVAARGGSVEWVSTAAKIATVSGLDDAAAAALAAESGIGDVEPDELITLERPDASLAPEAVDFGAVESPFAPQTAFFFPRQWHLRAVQADVAWAGGQLGSAGVTVAILDTGIDPSHADLVGRVDATRSVDMLGTFTVNGVPFTEADTVAKYFPGRPVYTDLFFHGTHVAATVSSNALAAAGVTSQTTLMAVKVCAYLNTCPLSAVLNGVIYAADHGADVMNLSLGGSFNKSGNGRLVSLINTTFNYAKNKGVTIVVSAGNSAIDMQHDGNAYKTYCNTPATICVAASGPTAQGSVNGPWTNIDAPASYTNFGRGIIDLASPGGNAASFVWAACSRTSLLVPVCGTGTFVIGSQGTSMAAPHVTGTAALLVSQLGRNPAAIKARLQKTTDDTDGPGTDPFSGKGRVNTARAAGVI